MLDEPVVFFFFKFIERGLIAFYDGENRDGCLNRLKLLIFNQVYFLNHFYHMLLRNGKYTFIPYFLHTPLFELATVFLRLPITSLTSHLFFFTLEFKGRFCSGLDSRPHLHSHRLLLLCCGSHH